MTTPADSPILVEGVNHFYGRGELRKQVLYDVDLEIRPGEIVIVTGPSGSGKTTLLTLIGALRSAQEGSVRVLGHELRKARSRSLEKVRRQIGYVFQAHNLIDALSARQNVEMSLHLGDRRSHREVRRRARAMLEAVGLGEHVDRSPSQLSGGQRQRVAIARALAPGPRILLADEPTASLDRQAGREVVDLIQALAKDQAVPVLLVTHDNRILDVADRIVHLEDGRISSFTEAVRMNNEHMMHLLAESKQRENLESVIADLSEEDFAAMLELFTQELQKFLESTRLANDEAFESMLDRALRAFTFKLGQVMGVERASIFLVDDERDELWLKVAQEEGGKKVDLRIPLGSGIAGHVAQTGEPVRVDDAYSDPRFNPEVDRQTGFRTRSILCLPIRDSMGHVFAVAQMLNRVDGEPFDELDQRHFREFTRAIGVVLESWWQMSQHSGA